MDSKDFLALKDGDQVRYIGHGRNGWPETGTILTRKEVWLDDDKTVKLTFVDDLGLNVWSFFAANEVEVIKGELA